MQAEAHPGLDSYTCIHDRQEGGWHAPVRDVPSIGARGEAGSIHQAATADGDLLFTSPVDPELGHLLDRAFDRAKISVFFP
nr:hypothetical protein [uncultured Paraburkholderia sp.]